MRHVTVRYERDLPHDVPAAYAWLTDYSDTDHERAGAIIEERGVLERHPDRVVLKGVNRVLGTRLRGTAVVHLHPPDHWVAEIGRGHGRYEYRLTPRPGGSRLTIHYHLGARRLGTWLKLQVAKPAIRRELDRMWDGFCKAMDDELGASNRPPSA